MKTVRQEMSAAEFAQGSLKYAAILHYACIGKGMEPTAANMAALHCGVESDAALKDADVRELALDMMVLDTGGDVRDLAARMFDDDAEGARR